LDIGIHQPTSPDGLSRYSSNLLKLIKKIAIEDEVFLISRKGSKYSLHQEAKNVNLLELVDDNSIFLFPSLDVHFFEASEFLIEMKAKSCQFKFLIADLIAVDYPEYFNPGVGPLVDWYISTICELADIVIVPTQVVERRLIDFLIARGHRFPDILVGSPGIDHVPNLIPSESKNLVVIGTIEPRKQNLLVAKAFLKSGLTHLGFHMTFAGKLGWLTAEETAEFKSICVSNPGLAFKNNLNDLEIFELLSKSFGLIQYSVDEGYGLTVMEAAAYRKPVFVSDIPVFRETTNGCAFFSSKVEPSALGLDLYNFATSSTRLLEEYTPDIDSNQTWKNLARRWLG